MRTITVDLEAILKDRFQAAGSGYAARFEVGALTPPAIATGTAWRSLRLHHDGGTINAEPSGWHLAGFNDSAWDTGYVVPDPPGQWEPIVDADFLANLAARSGNQMSNLVWIARQEFDVDGVPAEDPLLRWNSDNTARIWINDTLLIAGGDLTFQTPDGVATPIPVALLIDGTNCIAVEITNDDSDDEFVFNPSMFQASMQLAEFGTGTYHPSRANLNKNLRMGPDQAEIEIPNEQLPLGFGPTSIFPTNSRCRLYQWFGDDTNAVLTFTGVIDKIGDSRDPLTTSLSCRSLAGPILVDQTFSTTAPQGADEDGHVRTEANGVYVNREVDYIALDVLDRAGWPEDDIDVLDTSFVLDEFIRDDGETTWDTLARLAGFVGYTLWDDEDGVIHLRTLGDAAAVDTDLTADYTYEIGGDGSSGSPHVMMLGWETDQYDLRTRVKVRGPLTTFKDAWTEVWRTSKIAYPVGIWFAPSEPTIIRVLDRSTKRIYKLRQSDRKILSSVYIGGSAPHPLGLSGDPADASVYWVLESPWRTTGATTGNKILKLRKSDNAVLARWAIPNGRWSAIKVSTGFVWLTNLDTDKIYKRSKTTGASIASYSITYNAVAQTNPSGIMVDGSTLYYFFSNSGTTARFLKADVSAPRTITGVVKTAGTQLHGGEMDTVTHTECYGDSDSLHLTAKFTLKEPVTHDVAQEAIDTDLEDELGLLAELGDRVHDSHPDDPAHPFLVRRETMSIEEVTSLAQAMQVAQIRLGQLNGRREVLDVGIVGNPALQKTDLVRVTDPVTGMTVDGRVDTLETDMSADGPFVGTLALLPQSVIITDDVDDDGSSADAGGIDENGTPDTSDPGPDD